MNRMAATASTSQTQSTAIAVSGMDCASCVVHVEKAAQRVPGVQSCDVSLARGRAVVRFDPSQANARTVADAITEAGYPAAPEVTEDAGAVGLQAEQQRLNQQMLHARSWLRRAIVAI